MQKLSSTKAQKTPRKNPKSCHTLLFSQWLLEFVCFWINQSINQSITVWRSMTSYHTFLFSSDFWNLCAIESINQSINQSINRSKRIHLVLRKKKHAVSDGALCWSEYQSSHDLSFRFLRMSRKTFLNMMMIILSESWVENKEAKIEKYQASILSLPRLILVGWHGPRQTLILQSQFIHYRSVERILKNRRNKRQKKLNRNAVHTLHA